jgi:hypothetical protein
MSSRSTSITRTNRTNTGDTLVEGRELAASLTGARGGKGGIHVTIDRSGFDQSGVEGIIREIAGSGQALTERIITSQGDTARALEGIAMHSTGSQTEVGRTIDRLAMPVIITIAVLIGFAAWTRRGRR